MSALKDQVLAMIRKLPDDATLEDMQYHLYVLEKVRRGIEAADEGRTLTQEEAEARLRRWIES